MDKALKETFRFLKSAKIGIEPPKLNIVRLIPLLLLNWCIPFVFNTKWAETVISNHALGGRAEMEML
jgi:2-dehydropantoate 2-reductase